MGNADYRASINALMDQIEDQNVLANVFRYLERFSKIKKGEKFELSDEQKEAIDEGLESIAKDGTMSHEQVMTEMRAKYPDLYQ